MKTKTIHAFVAGCIVLGCAGLQECSAALITVESSPTGLTVVVDGTNYTAPAIFDWEFGSKHSLDVSTPQLMADGHSRSVFDAWSDAQPPYHEVTVPETNATLTAIFKTQYLLETKINPLNAGSISNFPAGQWFDSGTSVALAAITNSGYRFYFWNGVDSFANGTAQVSMTNYRTVLATFQPADFPLITVSTTGSAAPGNLIGNIGGRTADGTKLHYVVLDNSGTNIVFANKTNTLYRFVTPQGFNAVSSNGNFVFKDETYNATDTVGTIGYPLNTHDIKELPNGHVLLFATEVRTVDMSSMVPGGKSAASVTGDIIQELDASKRLVFEWHCFDHVAVTNTFADMTQSSFDYAHVNAVTIDPIDNNLLASLRTTSEIVKINRQNGEIIWRLGGKNNQFTYIGEHAENAPYYTVGQHDVHRLANGNLMFFDNGNISGGGVTPNDRTYTRVVEYALDEVSMTATLVWEYRHTPDISASCTGSIKRFSNGNTLIDWGCAVPVSGTILTEVNAAGQVVFEMKHKQTGGISSVQLGGGLTKQLWNDPDLAVSTSIQGVQSGQTYDAPNSGATLLFTSLSGPSENSVTIRRYKDAVRFAQFSGKAPQVLLEHVVLSSSNITALAGELSLKLPNTSFVFDTPIIHEPGEVTVYYRATPGSGQFSALTTAYDEATGNVKVNVNQTGEFIFGYPDLEEIPFSPAILNPPDLGQVNQSVPIPLTWVPQGLVGTFELQIASDSSFSNMVLSTNGLSGNNFSFQNPAANSQYYWRIRAINQGGTSSWASASFTTVPPMLQVTSPAGGEVWQRFQVVTVRWLDNISENVALDLYLDGVSNRTFVTSTASSGAYTWTIGQFATLPQSTNYTIKIRSVTTPALYDFSERFSIITNLTPVTVSSVPPGLSVTVDGTNYTTPTVFSWLPQSTHTVNMASPQIATDGHSRYVFASWSDAGAQSHSIVVPFNAASCIASFATNYLLEASALPQDGGVILNDPVGPWYDAGQSVSLSTVPSQGFVNYTWDGVDSQSGTTATLTMTGYKSIKARFIPTEGTPMFEPGSFGRTPDGHMQFIVSAGAGLVTQATVWATPTLSPADWQILGTVELTAGRGTFTDPSSTNAANRFYRISLP